MRIRGTTKVMIVMALMAIAVFAFGLPAFATTNQNGPQPAPQLGDPVSGSSEKAVVKFTGTVTGGTYTFTFSGATTAGLAYNASASTVQTALEGLATIGVGNVAVSGSPSSTAGMTVTFKNVLGNQNLTDLTADFTGLTGTTPGGTVTITDGATVTGQVSPHGGYSAVTNFCLQCHSVHPATTTEGTFALLWKNTVTATCSTCHAIDSAYGSGTATGTRNTNTDLGMQINPPETIGTTSLRSAYDLANPAAAHPLGATSTRDGVNMKTSGWGYGGFNTSLTTGWPSRQTNDGLQCTSCHTSHGDFGRLINSPNGVVRTTAGGASLSTPQTFAEGRAVYIGRNVRYLHLDTDAVAGTPAVPQSDAQWEACLNAIPPAPTPVADGPDTTALGACSYLLTTDSEGQFVSLYGYKLLSAYPNFNWTGGGESWGLDASAHDMALWCGTCHPSKVADTFGGTFHNHPTGCTACHGNPSSDPNSTDFPHTSSFASFLKSYPDGLCISCHTAGSLP